MKYLFNEKEIVFNLIYFYIACDIKIIPIFASQAI